MEKKLVYLQTQHSKTYNKHTLDDICSLIYKKVLKLIHELSLLGYLEVNLGLTYENPKVYLIPKLVYWFQEIPELKKRLINKMSMDGFSSNFKDDQTLTISWDDNEPITPTISAKDVSEMGYNPSQFNIILFELRKAIIKGEATIKTKQSQIIWIKEHFPLK